MVHADIFLHPEVHNDPHHMEVITTNIAARFSEVQDEISAAFTESVPTDSGEQR